MQHFTEIRQIVNPEGEVVGYSKKRTTSKFINDKWSLIFFKSVSALADADCSKIAYRIFLYLLASGLNSQHIAIDKTAMAADLDLTPSFIRRAIRELVELNVLLEGRKLKGQSTYCFNPRIVWYGSTDQRPQDLSPYPHIGEKK